MSILDTTIVAVALATLGRDFHVSVTTIQWVSTGYLLALAMVIPVTGWAVDRFGAKLIWMTSLSLFIVGSCLCGVAWSANSLIVFRVLQGIGGGMLLPVGQSILARAAGPQRMGRVMSIIGVPMVLGPIMGPIIGGLIVSNYSWRWIFYINLPIGIVTLLLSSRWLPKWDTDERFASAFDTLGFCLLSPGLAALVYSLSEVGTTGSFTSFSVVFSFVLGVVLMTGFALHALRIKNPLLELHLFKDRTYSIANICIFVLGATLFGSMFLLPLYYQVARGQEAWVAGLLMAPQGIGAACIMRWAGSFTDRFGPRRIVPSGILLMAAATIPFAFVTTSTSEVLLAVSLFVRGLGLGLTMMPVTAAAYYNLNHAEIPKATTTMNIVRQVGGSVATALFAVVLERQIVSQLGPAAAKAGGSAGVISSTAKLPPQVADSVAAAFAHTFWWSVGAILLAFVPTLFLPDRPAPAPTVARAEGADGGATLEPPHDRRGDARLSRPGPPHVVDEIAIPARAGPDAWPPEEEAAELVAAADGDLALLHSLAERRLAGEPLAWITGRTAFGDLTVRVDHGVYVPRWQSLPLARRAAAGCPTAAPPSTSARGRGRSPPHSSTARPTARVVATDLDPRAVACARANGVEAYRGDLFAAVPPVLRGTTDVVVAVVPYVPQPGAPSAPAGHAAIRGLLPLRRRTGRHRRLVQGPHRGAPLSPPGRCGAPGARGGPGRPSCGP